MRRDFLKRTAVVHKMNTTSILNGSVYNIGDSQIASPVSKAIAVQKEGPPLQEDIHFESFSIFSRKANFPSLQPIVRKKTIHHNPNIYVKHSSIIAVSSA